MAQGPSGEPLVFLMVQGGKVWTSHHFGWGRVNGEWRDGSKVKRSVLWKGSKKKATCLAREWLTVRRDRERVGEKGRPTPTDQTDDSVGAQKYHRSLIG